jgi:signal transduction histidine kinase
VGSAIASEHSVFFWARLKLTGVYVLILAIILIGFSGILYQNLGRSLSDASEDDFSGIESHHHFVQNTLAGIENEIILIDLIILVVAAGVSYALAGYTLRPIQQSLVAQRIFSENASHELRTPLAVMRNDAEVLLRNPNPTKDQIHSTLRSNIEEIDRMTKMAKDLLALARSENGVTVGTERIDVADITKKIADKMRPIAAGKGVTLTSSSEVQPQVEATLNGLEHVLLNLLQNALEHTPKSGSITVAVSQEESDAIIKVSDTGSGIEEKDLPHIFERFYKGEGVSGSGLGLSIVKGLVEQHGGSISIESTKGKGTTATIRLPIAV